MIQNTLSSLIKQIFEIEMFDLDRKSFYLPLLQLPPDTRKDCFVCDFYRAKRNQKWIVDDLTI